MSEPGPDLSVVVLTWNSLEYLPDLVESLDRQRFQGFETIVVDNGSTDGTVEWLRRHQPEIRLIRNRRNRGYCRGMNQGAAAARADLLLLLNADLVLDSECLAALLRVTRADLPGLAGVFPMVLFKDTPLFINAFGVGWHERAHWRDGRVGMFHRPGIRQPERTFGSIFPALLVHREAFRRAGRFDPLFFSYCEDFDLCYRVNSLGLRWYTAPDALVHHAYRGSIRSEKAARRQQALFVRNYLAVFLKNFGAASLKAQWRYILYRYFGAPARQALREKRWRDLAPLVHGLAGFLLRLPLWLPRRWAIQRRRNTPDEQLWSSSPIEEFNLFHYNGELVMSLLNLRASRGESVEYEAHGEQFVSG